MRVRLILDVEYKHGDGSDLSDTDLPRGLLHDLVEFATNRGLLTDETDLVVDEHVFRTIANPAIRLEDQS